MRSVTESLQADIGSLQDAEIDTAVAALVSAALATARLGPTYFLVMRHLSEDIERFSNERIRRRAPT